MRRCMDSDNLHRRLKISDSRIFITFYSAYFRERSAGWKRKAYDSGGDNSQ